MYMHGKDIEDACTVELFQAHTLQSCSFNSSHPLVIIIHGWSVGDFIIKIKIYRTQLTRTVSAEYSKDSKTDSTAQITPSDGLNGMFNMHETNASQICSAVLGCNRSPESLFKSLGS